jgi:glycosyltransferase involved in cell wall biosynthesis
MIDEAVRGTDVKGMRVALVLATTAGGTGRHVRSIAHGLAARGARVAVLGPASVRDMAGPARFAEVDIADRPRPAADAAAVLRLRRLLHGADVVHAHGMRAGGLAVAARAGVPLVVTIHNAAATGGAAAVAYAALERLVARGADRVLTVSPDLAERMRALGARCVEHALVPAPASRRAVTPQERAAVRADLGADARPLVLTVARLAHQKGLDTLLAAAPSVPGALFVVAGEGPLEASLSELVEHGRLPVRLLGRRADVPVLLAAADVVAVPSRWEGQPLIVQEALRAGRPIVATRVGGIPAMVGDAAVLVEPGEGGALAGAIRRVLAEPDLAGRLSAAAKERAADLPGEDAAVGQLAAVYGALARA